MDMKVEIYTEISSDLRDRWLELWHTNGHSHPFNHPAWFEVAPAKTQDADRIVIVGSKTGQACLFMMTESDGKDLRLLGSPYMEKSAILVDTVMSENDWKVVIETLLADYDRITFQEVPQDVAEVLKTGTVKAWQIVRMSSLSPFFNVDNPLISSKRRHELRRYTRKLEKEHGPLAIEFLPLTVERLETMADIEKRSTKPEKARAEFENRTYFNFIRNAISAYEGACWIGLLSLAGIPMAHYAGMIYHRHLLGLHMAFDKSLNRYSPGGVLIFNLLPILKEKNIELFDFGRGESVAKTRFSGDQNARQDTFYFFRKNLRGTSSLLKTLLIWEGISQGRRLRRLDSRTINKILDRFKIKR